MAEKVVTDGGFKMFKKSVRKEAKDKFKAGEIKSKMKFRKAKKKAFKKSYEEGSWQ